jgi:hypothetical protein
MMQFLLTIGERIVPAIRELDAAAKGRMLAAIEHAIDARDPALRRRLELFLRIVRWTPVVRYGRRFERLTSDRQDRVLRWFQNAPIATLRQGFWGVKTLIFMAYYGRPEAGVQIGYRPSRVGNRFLNAR